MRFVALTVLLAASLLLAASAPGAVTVRTPVDDVGLPYWCDWGYDWDERCYRDAGDRLPIGGVDDKVWRSALRLSLLADRQEAYGVSGPYLPSMSFADPGLQPRLVVGYESPSGPAP